MGDRSTQVKERGCACLPGNLPTGGGAGSRRTYYNQHARDIPRIPDFAEGAIVTRPTLGIVGEGDHDEAIVPLDGRELGGNTTNLYVLGDIVSEDFVSDLVHKAGVNNDRRGLRRGPQQIGA